jgi:hypothetical protein
MATQFVAAEQGEAPCDHRAPRAKTVEDLTNRVCFSRKIPNGAR